MSTYGLATSFVDGDLTVARAISAPRITNPFRGDSAVEYSSTVKNDIIYTSADVGFPPSSYLGVPYGRWPVGQGPNRQLYGTTYNAVILEQDFMVASSSYQPIPLNTPYDKSAYWPGVFWGQANPNAFVAAFSLPVNPSKLYLTEETPLEDMDGGMFKMRRQYASIPPTRNQFEKFAYNYIGFGATDVSTSPFRDRFVMTVPSRVQQDFVILDPTNVLPSIPFWSSGGNRIPFFNPSDSSFYLIEQRYWLNAPPTTANNQWQETDFLTDTTNPSLSDYLSWCDPLWGGASATIGAAEIVAEASSVVQWLGNIYMRTTRFVPAI